MTSPWMSTATQAPVCEDLGCGADGLLFRLPSGRMFCPECTSAYISWLLDGGQKQDPHLYDWLVEEAS